LKGAAAHVLLLLVRQLVAHVAVRGVGFHVKVSSHRDVESVTNSYLPSRGPGG